MEDKNNISPRIDYSRIRTLGIIKPGGEHKSFLRLPGFKQSYRSVNFIKLNLFVPETNAEHNTLSEIQNNLCLTDMAKNVV